MHSLSCAHATNLYPRRTNPIEIPTRTIQATNGSQNPSNKNFVSAPIPCDVTAFGPSPSRNNQSKQPQTASAMVENAAETAHHSLDLVTNWPINAPTATMNGK
jgi:hypothetical protein